MRRSATALLLLFAALRIAAQVTPITAPATPVVDERLQIASAGGAYPVTPGDVYTLTFLLGSDPVISTFQVESDHTLNLALFGRVNTRGLTIAQLRPQVETLVQNAYPRSLPAFTISAVGLFQVTLAGAIPRTQRVTAWGLSRLSEVIEDAVAPYTSLRNVTITRDGRTSTYDVFRALDQGALDQDPLLRPGDAITFSRMRRVVTVRGEMNEPGRYELTDREGFDQLLSFASGFTPEADQTRLVVQRQADEVVEQVRLSSLAAASRFELRDGDVLIVPPRIVPRPVVYVEGAVRIAMTVQLEAEEQSDIPVYNRITRELTVGDTLYSLLLEIQDELSPFADIERGYIIRQSAASPIRINMREVLYRQSSQFNNFVLQAFDRVVIPLDQPYVAVTGDVTRAGRYPYNPGSEVTYYLNLAGTGAESIVEAAQIVRVYGRDGNEVPATGSIQTGYTIHVPVREPRVVVVSGDVPAPGAFPWAPERDWRYYLRLAGVGAVDFTRVRENLEYYDTEGAAAGEMATVPSDFTLHVRPLPPVPEEVAEIPTVAVVGGVNAPGLFPVAADRTAAFYVRLAGGINRDQNTNGALTVFTESGVQRPLDSIIEGGDTIEVARNSFLYNFGVYFPIITTGLGFITTIIALITTLNR